MHIRPQELFPYLDDILPSPILEIIESEIVDLLTNTNSGFLSLGILGILWSASAVMRTLQTGFDRAYSIKPPRTIIASGVFPVITIIIVILLALVFVIVTGFSETLIVKILGDTAKAEDVVSLVRNVNNLIALTVPFILFSAIYIMIPNAKLKLREVLPGGIFSAIAFVSVNRLFGIYANYALRPTKVYGTSDPIVAYRILSVLFMLGLWLRLISYVMMLGTAINATFYRFRHAETIIKENRIDKWIQKQKDRLVHFLQRKMKIKR